ncbi:hypothetical protein QFZ91_000370 [Paraburkholderia sp. JPY419]
MIESKVYDGVGLRGAAAQAVGVFERAAMHLRARCDERLRALIGAGHADHLMAGFDKFGHQSRADKPGCACQKDSHGQVSRIATDALCDHSLCY